MTVFLSLLLLFGAVEQKRAVPQFERLSKQAAVAREANRLDQAAGLYRQALKLNPSWAEGWWSLGTLLYDQDHYSEARDAFRHFLDSGQKDARALALLGLCEFQTKEYELSLGHLNQARRLGIPTDQIKQVVLYHAALLLTHFEQFESALQILLDLARQGNESPSVIEASGLAALRKPILPNELASDDRALVFRTGRAVLTGGERRAVEAQKLFEQLVADYPNTPNVHYLYASFLLLSSSDQALQEFNKELEIDPRHLPALVASALEYEKRGEPESGLKQAEQAVDVAPKSFAAHAALGKLLVATGKVDSGIQELETSVRLAPDSPQTRIALASAYAKAGRQADAAKQRQEFLNLKKRAEESGEK